MSRSPTSNSPKRKRAKREPLARELGFDVGPIMLYDISLDRAILDNENDGEDYPILSVSVVYPFDRAQSVFAVCHITVESMPRDRFTADVNASYAFDVNFVDINPELKYKEEVIEFTIIKMVWPAFKSIFAILDEQAELDLPSLPFQPDHIHHLPTDDESGNDIKKSEI